MKYIVMVVLVISLISLIGCGESQEPRQRVDSEQVMFG